MKKLFYFSNLLTLCLILSSVTVKAAAPVISVGPRDTTLCVSSVAMFTFTATDTPTSYYWQVSPDGINWSTVVEGGAYAGAANDTLHVTSSMTLSGNRYRAYAIKGPDTSLPSLSALLTVVPMSNAGIITGTSVFCHGTSVTLADAFSGGTWSISNAAIATINASGMVTGITHGVDTVYYMTSNMCGADTSWYSITVDSTLTSVMPITGPDHVCAGSHINLANADAVSGAWSISNANATITSAGVVTGVVTGSDTAMYTISNTCNSLMASRIITIEAPLSAGTISGPAYLCAGSLVAFSATMPGGIWLSNDGTVATVDMFGNVTGHSQGNAIISHVFTNSCGSFVAADTITVQSAAAVVTGMDSVGVGATTLLSNATINGMWMSSDTTVARIDTFTGLVHGIAVGTATMSYSVTNICGTTTTTILMHVGTAPGAGTIVGMDSVCLGNSITLTNATSGGTWGVTNANGTITAGGVFSGLIGRVKDTVTYTVTDGFGTTVIKKAIYINTPPVVTLSGPTAPSLGTAYTLGATPSGGAWTCSEPSSKLTFISANTIVILVRDTFDLVYTVSNTCGTTIDTFTITLTPASTIGIENINGNASAMNIYPNPSTGAFLVNLSAETTEDAHVVITNMVGETVKEITIPTNKATGLTLSAPAGMYMLSATTAHGHYTSRIIIAK